MAKTKKRKNRIFYTDGACSNNGDNGIGGYAVIELVPNKNGYETKIEQGHKDGTTNNEMELTAVYKALVKSYKENGSECMVTIYCDSAYVVNALQKGWLNNWANNGWVTKEGKPIKNKKIWYNMYRLIYEKGMHLTMIKVKGHDLDPINQLADRKAVEAKGES